MKKPAGDYAQLREDLIRAEGEWGAADFSGQKHEERFWAADRALRELPPQPVTSKATRLAAYDERMAAGHAWHPYKERMRRANAWIKAIQAEMKQVGKAS